jgi:hypothetical protein
MYRLHDNKKRIKCPEERVSSIEKILDKLKKKVYYILVIRLSDQLTISPILGLQEGL